MLTRVDIHRRSLRSRWLSWFLRRRFKPILMNPDFDPLRFRRALDRDLGSRPPAADVSVDVETGAPVAGEWNIPHQLKSSRIIIYSHGGGYLFGSPLTHRSFTTRLASATGMKVFVPDYRLAPEHLFPAAAEDMLATYQWLLQQMDSSNIVLVGDSAGGGLSLALLAQIKQHGLPMPACAVLMSPYADLSCSGASLDENSATCAMFTGDVIRRAAQAYLGGADSADPRASPLYADLSGLPPLAIYVSDNEVLRDDGLRVAEKAAAAGVPVRLYVRRGQPHVWPLFAAYVPEASEALADMAEFIHKTSTR